MQDKALEFEKLRGAQRMAEIGAAGDAAWNAGAIEALKEAVAGQGRASGVKWADTLSASVRPVITYWFMGLYCAAKTVAFSAAVASGASWGTAILHAWTEADQALWAGVLNFGSLAGCLNGCGRIAVPQAAVELAKRFEGFHRVPKNDPGRAHPYICPAGYWTIGYGHQCGPDHPPITDAEGEAYLANDLRIVMNATLRFCPVLATEPES